MRLFNFTRWRLKRSRPKIKWVAKTWGGWLATAVLLASTQVIAEDNIRLTSDQDGPDDVPAQTDVTLLGFDDTHLPEYYVAQMQFDDTVYPGGNSGDGCIFFDSDDAGGFSDFAVCGSFIQDEETGQVKLQSAALYDCKGSEPDNDEGKRCGFIGGGGDGSNGIIAQDLDGDGVFESDGNGDPLATPYDTTCSLNTTSVDPFNGVGTHNTSGEQDPVTDTQLTCRIYADELVELDGDVPNGIVVSNACSFTSPDPSSESKDCVFKPGSGFLVLEKLAPGSEDGEEFSFTIDGEPLTTIEVFSEVGSTDVLGVPGDTAFNLAEIVPDGWVLASSSCDNGNLPSALTVNAATTVTCTFTNELDFVPVPDVFVTKSAVADTVVIDTEITYNYEVSVPISGNVPLSPVTVTDDKCSPTTFNDGDTNSDGILDLDETWNYECTTVINDSDIDEGSEDVVTNIVTATGTYDGVDVSNTASAMVTVLFPSLAIDKPAPSNADEDGSGDVSVGDTLTYTITATNDGTANLTNVVVSDAKITVTGGTTPCALAPGETCTLIGTYEVTAADVTATKIENIGKANSDQTGEVTDPETVTVPVPELSLVKSGVFNDENGDTFANADVETISYSFIVASTGTANLTNVLVSDPLPGLSAISCPSGYPIAFLAAGDQETCTATYTITQDDVDAGVRDNEATADSAQTGPVDSPASVDLPQNPNAVVTKSSNPVEVAAANTVINYTVTLTNTGNVTLDPAGVTLTDLINGTIPVTLSPAGGDTDGDGKIDVTEAWSYTGSYTVTQADMDAGLPLINTVCISDIDGSGAQEADECGDATTTITQLPNHSFAKDFLQDPVDIGSDSSFTLTYTNTGNVTLSDIEIVDQVAAILDVNTVGIDVGSCDPASQAVSCSVDSLAPTESAVVTVGYTAAPDLPMTNQTSGASYVFYFANGYVLTGSTADGTATLTDPNGVETPADVGGANQDVVFNAPDGQTFTMHLSCSEPFVSGYGLTGPTESDNPEWQISNYSVDRYNSQGFLKSCGQTFIPLFVDNTASAQATPAGGDLVPNPIEASDSVELLQESPIEISRTRVRRGDVELQYFNTNQEAIEIDIIGITWTDGAVLESATYQDGVDLGLSGGSPQSADISNILGARKKDWLKLSFSPGGAPDGLVITIVTTDGSTLTYEF